MNTQDSTAKPAIEPSVEPPSASAFSALETLRQRIEQQEFLAQLGVKALQGASLQELLDETARLTAAGLRVNFCKVLEHLPTEQCLIVRAGVGWASGTIGVARVGLDLASPAGFALQTGRPVISNHLELEDRFRTPELLAKHGIHRAMNVILQGDGKPYGVLEVDSCSQTAFVEQDLAFLQGAANILGMAIERERHERRMTAALERDVILLQEMSHRVKNSLSIVVSMLNLQAREVGNAELTAHLREASRRVAAVAQAHDQLAHNSDVSRMDIGRYISAVTTNLNESVASCELITDFAEGITIPTANAISIALIVNELLANAAKYAYRNGGKIWISGQQNSPTTFTISVRDEGDGLPADFDITRAKGLGMRIITAFASQLQASVVINQLTPGTEFVLTVPCDN
jgi:two-component sensor histidine kinase